MKKVFGTIVFLIFAIKSYSQNLDSLLTIFNDSNELPKIGLALSGGAAHGLAHVGTIKYLEELGIPIDYITGTSMGAIVGGIYAMGYTYEEMMEIIGSKDWDVIVSNETSLNEVSPYEKEFHDKIPIKLRIEQSKLLLPKAIFDGHKLDLAITELFSPSNLVETFDDLPRPFRCYAVDLLSGEIIEMRDGNLGQAIRASMAIPSVFTPIPIDSLLLVDGGLLKNFPVKENKSMGSDIVIGVYVGSKRSKIEDVKSMVDILRLTGFLSSLNDTEEQKKVTDILVEPDVKDYPLLDFKNFNILVEEGYQAARKDSIKFMKLAALFRNRTITKEILPLKLPQKFFIESVSINGTNESYTRLLRSRVKNIEQNQAGFDEISEAIAQCFATNNLQTINYSFKDGSLGQVLEVEYSELKESSIGISANHFANTNTALIFHGTLRNIFAPMTNAIGYARLSDNPGVFGKFYRRLGSKKDYIFEVGLNISREKNPILIDRKLKKELIFNKFRLYIGMSKEIDNNWMAAIKYGFNNRSLKPQLLDLNDITDYDQNLQDLSFELSSNSLPEFSYPQRGHYIYFGTSFLHNVRQEASFIGNGAKVVGVPNAESNFKLQFKYLSYLKVRQNLIFSYFLSTGIFLEESLFDVFQIGGTHNFNFWALPFIGGEQGEFRYQEYLYARNTFTFSLSPNVYFSLVYNFIRGRSYSPKFIDKLSAPSWQTTFGYGLSAGIETLIGPINIDVGSTRGLSELSFAVGVGYRFIN